jgi:lipopolysaccharide transport system ATP-binding protein
MSEAIISVEHLGKRYRIRHQQQRQRYVALRDVLADRTKSIARRLWSTISAFRNVSVSASQNVSISPVEDFWALRDVSFEVNQGDVLGIIGRNGAGKSTLLKILSRITEPTEGRVRIKGRVASLLEVGTGFHPELTGRENIFLNGAILGMHRAEIKRKFDDIVAFAEVEKFLDTPVKRYSSGMYVRLAFAVAAHLEPEILIVDEVLAVGDAEFQKKCLGKMQDVSKGGRTVLFVSHNMSQIARICQRCLLLQGGSVKADGDVTRVTTDYLKGDAGHSGQRIWPDLDKAPGDEVARLKSVRVISDDRVTDVVRVLDPVTIEMEFWNFREGANLAAAFSFINSQGVILFVTADFFDPQWGQKPRPRGLHRARCVVPGGLFSEGLVTVVAEVSTRTPVYHIHFLQLESVVFQVVDAEHPGSLRKVWARDIPGVLRPMQVWQGWASEFLGEGSREHPRQAPALSSPTTSPV